VPCSGARRQNKALDEVSAAILGGVAAENAGGQWQLDNRSSALENLYDKGAVKPPQPQLSTALPCWTKPLSRQTTIPPPIAEKNY